jgi:hypothetical protein
VHHFYNNQEPNSDQFGIWGDPSDETPKPVYNKLKRLAKSENGFKC